MQRLVHPANMVRSQARGHRLDTLALTGQQQAVAVQLQWGNSVGVPCGLRQALEVSRKAFFLGPAWRRKLGAHAAKLIQDTLREDRHLVRSAIFITQ